MRSKAHFKTHPIHPMLVGFPIAFFFGAFIVDVISYIVNSDILWLFGFYLTAAGIVSGFLAAIPGFIDYTFTLPDNSSAKKRGTTHALLNSSALISFIVSILLRQSEDMNLLIILGLDIIGVILLTIAGWHGATLVYRNQIGVDIRYAGAGKWIEEHFEAGQQKIQVAVKDELKNNQMKLIHVGDKRIVLCNSEGRYAAFDDSCTHRGGALSGGALICGTVQCPWHGSQFDIWTGEAKEGPADKKIKTYKVTEEEEKIFIELFS